MLLLGYEYDEGMLKLLGVQKDRAVLIGTDPRYKAYCLTQDEETLPPGYAKKIEKITLFDGLSRQQKEYSKIYVDGPSDVEKLRKRLKTCWEAWTLFHLNYAMDHSLVFGCEHELEKGRLVTQGESYAERLAQPLADVKRCAVDIEVRVKIDEKKLNLDKLDVPIACVAIVGSDEQSVIFTCEEIDTQIMAVKVCSDEQEMLSEVITWLEKYPVKLTFGGDLLDLPYLKKRCDMLNIESNIRKKRNYWGIAHNTHVDLAPFFFGDAVRLRVYNKVYSGGSLGEIAHALLGRNKLGVEDYEKVSILELALYCWMDAKLTLELSRYDDNYVWNLLLTICRIANVDMESVARTNISTWIRNFYRSAHRVRGHIVPSEKDMWRVTHVKTYRGPIVLDPVELGTVGVYFDVWALDFSSLYPSCWVEHNISYDTYNCEHEECKKDLVPELNFWFCKKHQGILPMMLSELKVLRVEKYKPESKNNLKAKAISDVLKIFTNAAYGIFGSVKIKDLFFYPVPRAITAYGRQSLMTAMQMSKEMGGQVLAGHTDSLFLRNLSREQINVLASKVSERLGVELEVQQHCRLAAFWRKANYLIVDDKGSVVLKGLMGKKTYVPSYIRKKFEELKKILGKVQTKEELINAKIEMTRLIQDTWSNIQMEKVPLRELASAVVLHRDIDRGKGQDYEVARLLRTKCNVEVDVGDTILKIRTLENKCGYTALPLEMVDNYTMVNKEKLKKSLVTVFGQVMEPLGIDVERAMVAPRVTLHEWIG